MAARFPSLARERIAEARSIVQRAREVRDSAVTNGAVAPWARSTVTVLVAAAREEMRTAHAIRLLAGKYR